MLDTILRCLTTCTSVGQLLGVILIGSERFSKELQVVRQRILITATLWMMGMIFITIATLTFGALVLHLFWSDFPVITLSVLGLLLGALGGALIRQTLQ